MVKAVVTGGGGYVGVRLGQALVDAGYDVLLLDVCPPEEVPAAKAAAARTSGSRIPLGPCRAFAFADVRNQAALEKLFDGASIIFHGASYGMSGAQQLQAAMTEAVNVGGTHAVLEAAVAAGVERLVYLSTYNVVYGGNRIQNGDESLPYFPPHRHPDAYSRTKAEAEQAVLAANQTPLPGRPGCCLRTCALRPAAIYGPGEQRHLPRIVKYLEAGLFCFVIGGLEDGIVDWLHVDNLTHAQLLAAEALTKRKRYVAAGESYFIHDCWPGVTTRVNNFEFLRPLVQGLGYRFPTRRVPSRLMYCLAWLMELLQRALWPVFDLSRIFLLTRAEVLKSSGTHYFSAAKAQQDLGYAPCHYDFQPVVEWFKERTHGHERPGQAAAWPVRKRQQLAARWRSRWWAVAASVLAAVLLAAVLRQWVLQSIYAAVL